MDADAAILLLSELPGVGEKTLGEVLRHCSQKGMEPQDLLGRAHASLTEAGLPAPAVDALRGVTRETREAAETAARGLRASSIRILTEPDPAYPRRFLERMVFPPPVLYAFGSLDLLAGPTFAVANSNGVGEKTLALCDAAAEQLVQSGSRPVTGHNRPAYQRTALAALRFGGPVCYVLDRGLFEAFDGDLRRELFPAAHVWSRAYDPACALTLSPFPLRAHGIGAHNRRRDELVFALADDVLVGEVRAGGQMHRCVLTALEQGRTVYLVGPPSDLDKELIHAGATRGLPES